MNKAQDIITTICIIRHGETDWNATGRLQGTEDIELNALGRKQALEIARFLKKNHWDLIITSPLKRAAETAKIISNEIGLPDIQVSDALRERDYGEASGLLPDERHSRFPDGKIPGQEEFEHLRSRAFNALTCIATDNQGKNILVVSHGAFTNSILYTISQGEYGSFKTRLKNACLNLLKLDKNQWSVQFYNMTPADSPAFS